MGSDVYTTTLAAHLRNLDATTAALLSDGPRRPLTSRGVEAAARDLDHQNGTNLGAVSAYLHARRLCRSLGLARAGSPFASLGPGLHMEPDQLAARQWHVLAAAVATMEPGAELDRALESANDSPLDGGFFDDRWDTFPGIAFARAVERANSLIVPASDFAGFAAGSAAVASTSAGEEFLSAIADRLEVGRDAFDEDYDPEMSREANAALHNPRLLAFHLGECERSGMPLGVWG